MGVYVDTKTFKSGNSVAVRLPRELGFKADVPVRLEKVGDELRLSAIKDPAEGKRQVMALIAALDALPPVTKYQEREPFEAPERDWLP
jgi:antitoxin VapB